MFRIFFWTIPSSLKCVKKTRSVSVHACVTKTLPGQERQASQHWTSRTHLRYTLRKKLNKSCLSMLVFTRSPPIQLHRLTNVRKCMKFFFIFFLEKIIKTVSECNNVWFSVYVHFFLALVEITITEHFYRAWNLKMKSIKYSKNEDSVSC